MHLILANHGLPMPEANGGPILCWAIMQQMLAAGHQVTVLALRYPNDPFWTPENQAAVTGQGVQLLPVDTGGMLQHVADGPRPGAWTRLRLAFSTDPYHAFPTARLTPLVRPLLDRQRPDAIFAFHWDTLAAMHGLRVAPRLALMGDPWHLPARRGWQQARPWPTPGYLHTTWRVLRDAWVYPRAMVRLLKDCEVYGCIQPDVARWLCRQGATECAYMPMPVMDQCGPEWQARRNAAPVPPRPKILLGPSHLNATSTSAGVRLFATEILPRLEQELGPEGFEVHVVGDGKPPAELARLLPRPSVALRGRVPEAAPEFLSSSIQLSATPFLLGIRTRIIVGFSFGCCVVAHANEAVNIPQMVHEQNALLADSGPGLATAIIRAVNDPTLRTRLGARARRTYEEVFHPRVAAGSIVAQLEEVARRQAPPRQ